MQVNSLQRFYPPQQLEAVAQRVARVDFAALAARCACTQLNLTTVSCFEALCCNTVLYLRSRQARTRPYSLQLAHAC